MSEGQGVLVQISLSLPRESGSVSAVRRIVASAMAEAGVEQSCAADVELALAEGCANVVRHAQSRDHYRVTFQLSRKQALINIKDTGQGFDLNGKYGMASPFAEGGRGLALMRMLMDEADFHIEQGRGTEVSLIKHIVLAEGGLLHGAPE